MGNQLHTRAPAMTALVIFYARCKYSKTNQD
jgi:hypothetical protein